MFVFCNVCPCISVYSLTCGKCMFSSWVPAGTCHMLIIFSSVCNKQITSDREGETNSIYILTIWYLNDAFFFFFLATLRNLEWWGALGSDERKNRIKEGWAALGQSRATVLYRHMNDKRKEHSKTALQTECVWKSPFKLESSDTRTKVAATG